MAAVPALLLASLLQAGTPDPAPPPWQGVWQGTVGTLPVRACLAQRGPDHAVGSYYYLSRLHPIPLERQGDGWGEAVPTGKPAPRWTFTTIAADRLSGEWRDGGRRLPLRLTRVASGGEPCEDVAFHAPRLRELRPTITRATIDGTGYARLRFDPGPAFANVTLESFALAGRDATTGRINARLREEMPADAAKGPWFGCVVGNVGAQGRDGDYEAIVRPTLLTERWLAASESTAGYCGGAHPWNGSTSLLFDRRTGTAIDLTTWLNAAAIDRDDDGAKLRPALRRVVLAHARPVDPECAETVAAADYWDIGLTRTGMAFTPQLPHVVTACSETSLVPWPALSSWLSDSGRAGRATLSR